MVWGYLSVWLNGVGCGSQVFHATWLATKTNGVAAGRHPSSEDRAVGSSIGVVPGAQIRAPRADLQDFAYARPATLVRRWSRFRYKKSRNDTTLLFAPRYQASSRPHPLTRLLCNTQSAGERTADQHYRRSWILMYMFTTTTSEQQQSFVLFFPTFLPLSIQLCWLLALLRSSAWAGSRIGRIENQRQSEKKALATAMAAAMAAAMGAAMAAVVPFRRPKTIDTTSNRSAMICRPGARLVRPRRRRGTHPTTLPSKPQAQVTRTGRESW